jgi:flagellar assembly protein FliH/type III secretion protein L
MTLERARIIKGGAATAPAPIHVPLARRIPREVMDAKAEAERIIAGAEERARLAVEAASADAREREIAKLAAQVLAMREADERRAERDLARTIEVATILAERLIGEALNVDPKRIAELATSALEQTRGAKRVRFDANPADVEPLRAVLGDLGQIAEVQSDESLGRGSLVVHTELGRVDARLQPQLDRLAEVLKK